MDESINVGLMLGPTGKGRNCKLYIGTSIFMDETEEIEIRICFNKSEKNFPIQITLEDNDVLRLISQLANKLHEIKKNNAAIQENQSTK